MIEKREIAGEPVRLISLPAFTRRAVEAWEEFVASDDIFGLDVEATAWEGYGTYDPSIKMRLIQFGSADEGWALDPADERWRKRIVSFLSDESKRFVSHNAAYDTTRVLFEFGVHLGERSIDTLPMASLLWPGNTAPGGRGLKALCDVHIDNGLSQAEEWLHGRFTDLFYAQKERKGRLLPASFIPGLSSCRRPRQKGGEKCTRPSATFSLCGYCEEHYLTRKCNAEAKTWGWRNIPLDDPIFLRYAGLDAVYVRRLLSILAALVAEAQMNRLSRTEQRIKRFMTDVSVKGMRVDKEWTENILSEVEVEFNQAEADVEKLTDGVKARSYQKMQEWFGDHGVRVKSLDKDHLPELIEDFGDDPFLGPVLDGLSTISLYSNLLSNLRTTLKYADRDGFVHPNINTLQAHTGRMSITDPAMQTLAKNGEKGERLRGCYIARDGFVLVGADYDSQEIRLGAALSKDPALLRIVREGLNQHVLTAESIFSDFKGKADDPERYHQAKTLDFAQQYGAMPRKIAKTLKISESEAFELWKRWRVTYAGLVKWSEKVAKERVVRNPFGRAIPRDPRRDYANANYLIQSSGRDVLGQALCNLADAGWSQFFWLPIHDELVMEVPEDRTEEACDALTEHMTMTVRGVEIPATGEVVGTRWRGLG